MMKTLVFRKGIELCASYPVLAILALIYVNLSVWLMTRDANSQWQNSRKLMTSSGRFSKFELNGLITYKENKFTLRNLTKQKKPIVSKKNVHIITNFSSEKHSLRSDSHKCSMERYLCYTTKNCQPIFTKFGRTSPIPANKTNDSTVNVNFHENYACQTNDNENQDSGYSACDIDNVFFDCETLTNSYMFGKESVSVEEELFPLAFTMKIHKSDNQAHRLLRYIYQKHNLYCIHIDKKASADMFFKFLEIAKCFDNIIVIKDRVNVVYSTIKQIEAEFKCMKAMIEHNTTWKYYINLTGEEFMLKTNLEIVKILKMLNGTNDIESTFLPPNEYHKINRKTLIIGDRPFVSEQKKSPFTQPIKIRKGSAYGMFSREFVNFVLTDPLVKKFVDWLKDAYAPEELIWATVNNLPDTPGGRSKIISGESFLSRAVKWQTDRTIKCGGKYVRWVCVYGISDIPWLLNHRNIVANKFYENFLPLALDCVENVMYSRIINANAKETRDYEEYRKLLTSDI